MSKFEKKKKLFKFRQRDTHDDVIQFSENKFDDTKQFDKQLYQKFLNFISQCRWQKLKERINEFYGKNFTIRYQDKYKFKEQWQDSSKQEDKYLIDIMKEDNSILQLAYILVMLIDFYVIWVISIIRIFQLTIIMDSLSQSAYYLGLLSRLLSIAVNIYIKSNRVQIFTFKIITKIIFFDLFSFIYFTIPLINVINDSYFLIFPQIIVLIHLFQQAKNFYKLINLIRISLIYEYKYKIADLILNLIIYAHFFSLILYASTWDHNQESWIIEIGVDKSDYLTRYVYSFYFCSTTILTIGYGDVSPKNIREILVVTLIQFCGVAIFGYLINQIGHTLSTMRKNEQALQKDLRILGRIQKQYNIDQIITKRAKNYLLQNQCTIDQLTPEQQTKLVGKLSQQLRTQLTFEKSLSVIKTSIFFLCRWTKQIQSNMAEYLQKILLAPNETLIQPLQKQRIYIIKIGKVDIYINRFGQSKKQYRRFLKRICRTQESQIGSNIYGYTTVISTRPCALDAVASDFTNCYYINKQDFLKCVNKCQLDRQYYHEIKTRIDSSQFCQAYEAPSILNIRQHYNPSRTILIRKQRKKMSHLSNNQENYVRRNMRMKKHYFQKIVKLIEDINDKLIYCSNQFQEATVGREINQNKTALQQVTITEVDYRIDKNNNVDHVRQNLMQRQRKPTTLRSFSNALEANQTLTQIQSFSLKIHLNAYFQKSKQYVNFFPYGNLKVVLSLLDRQNYRLNRKEDKEMQIITTELPLMLKLKKV